MKVLVAIFVLVFTNNFVIEVTGFPKPNDIQNHLGSRTPYRFKSNKNDTQIKHPDCKDLKIWMIIRHGTRLPKTKDILFAKNLSEQRDEILLQHKNGKGQLTEKQLKQLQDWNFTADIEQEKFLTMEGQDEMVLLAERMQKRFPNAIKKKYNDKTHLFRHTATQRTHRSARHFTNGLFEKKDAQNVVFAPVTKVDNVLRFYKHCDKWQKQVKKNPETYKEQELYGISQEMKKTLESVSKRLGLDTVLSLESAIMMYKFCGYETAWYKHRMSPWCYAFDKKTIQTFEYYDDLKAYWLDGYGYELTHRLPCLSIKHMFNTFRNETSPHATFLFTHSGTILKILAYLGLYKPESHLRGTKIVEDRPWRISDIDSFAANIAFVLYKCKTGDHILTLHQEHVIRLPMCSQDLCPLKTIKDYFNDSVKNCNFEQMCTLDQGDITIDATTENTGT